MPGALNALDWLTLSGRLWIPRAQAAGGRGHCKLQEAASASGMAWGQAVTSITSVMWEGQHQPSFTFSVALGTRARTSLTQDMSHMSHIMTHMSDMTLSCLHKRASHGSDGTPRPI